MVVGALAVKPLFVTVAVNWTGSPTLTDTGETPNEPSAGLGARTAAPQSMRGVVIEGIRQSVTGFPVLLSVSRI
jgi:hypothetical protein